jgi:hypothetical protein
MVFKSEARNPKTEAILNTGNSNDPNKKHTRHYPVEAAFVIGAFDIRICFVF